MAGRGYRNNANQYGGANDNKAGNQYGSANDNKTGSQYGGANDNKVDVRFGGYDQQLQESQQPQHQQRGSSNVIPLSFCNAAIIYSLI
jgi:hypothetical protein